ncbi:ABC transporter permease [Alsobacter sp. SYSU M60028]|uniref:ABC transporter permease n=1 Tax=Alsobacter ponti TaxID=2962936 RepID=A0ABT1LAW5_9HYPH|nr:ABC transporter permease [Alsobacter ponti]MCP8938246.1 ABC transporter permease [Alsobacter ponti]
MSWILRRLDAKGILGFAILAVVVLCAVAAPWLSPLDPNAQDLASAIAPPAFGGGTAEHWLGTDRLGQDVLSRIIYGSRVSLVTALAAVAGSALVGTVLGMIAGYFGGFAATVVMRLVDIVLAVPFILLALVFMTVFGPSLLNVIIAFIAARWTQYTRIAYGLVLELREREFIQACVAAGLTTTDILLRHVLVNLAGPLLVVATLELGFVILIESGLSFLGLGTPPEVPSWGGMLQEGRALINVAWWLTTFPGLAIMLTVVGFNFIGDWMRDQFDPRTGSVRPTEIGSRD